ncbi:MAG: tetratricopeptide repeat protein [Lysobacterales bacterium]
MLIVLSSIETNPKDRWQAIAKTFEEALELDREQREGFLSDSDLPNDLLLEVRQMLQAHEGPALAMEEGVNPPQPPETLGPYTVERSIGVGGMGEVYLAKRSDGTFDRAVAIKTLRGWLTDSAVQARFLQESRLHAKLEHPNITRLLDAGVTPKGLPYLVTDFVDGSNIVEFADAQLLASRARVKLLLGVCDAVSFAHSRLVLHRDIKPSNILVTEKGEVRLLDFGIAKMLVDDSSDAEFNAPATQPGEQLMTLRYASPEQIRGEPLDVTCDVYSLGVVLFQLLTGQPPFDADTQWKLSEKITQVDPQFPPTSQGSTAVEADLQAICLKALEKKPVDRYASVQELAQDLRRFLGHHSVTARRPGIGIRVVRLLQRHPVAAPLSALAVLAIVSGGLGAAWQAHRAQIERDQARAQRDRAEQVTQVLVDLFDIDPYAEADQRRDNITLREFLLSRAGDIGKELEGQPQLKAQLLDLLARLLANLSLIDDAEPLAIEALDIRKAEKNSRNLGLATSLMTVGSIRQFQGQYAEAETLYRQALAIRREFLPSDDPLIVSSLNELSVSLHDQPAPEKQKEARELDEMLLVLNLEKYGPGSLQAAQSLNNLGALYVQSGIEGEQEKAVPLLRESLMIRRKLLGADHPNTATTAANLANLLHDLGELDEASQLFDEAISSTELAMGPQSVRLADVIYGSGFLLMDQKYWEAAARRFASALTIYQGALPENHPYVADGHFALGQAQQEMAQPVAASKNYLRATQIYATDPAGLDSELRAALHYLRVAGNTLTPDTLNAFVGEKLRRADSTVAPELRQQLESFVADIVSAN